MQGMLCWPHTSAVPYIFFATWQYRSDPNYLNSVWMFADWRHLPEDYLVLTVVRVYSIRFLLADRTVDSGCLLQGQCAPWFDWGTDCPCSTSVLYETKSRGWTYICSSDCVCCHTLCNPGTGASAGHPTSRFSRETQWVRILRFYQFPGSQLSRDPSILTYCSPGRQKWGTPTGPMINHVSIPWASFAIFLAFGLCCFTYAMPW